MEQNYITVDAVNAMLRSLVEQQVGVFTAQQQTIEAFNTQTRNMIGQGRDDVNKSLKANKQSAEAYVIEQVGALRAQTEQSVTHVDSKLDEMRDLVLRHDKTQAETEEKNKELMKSFEKFADEVKDSVQ